MTQNIAQNFETIDFNNLEAVTGGNGFTDGLGRVLDNAHNQGSRTGAAGAAIGTVGGAIAGGIAGAPAGGVGAVPGAAGGAIAGAAGGGALGYGLGSIFGAGQQLGREAGWWK